MLKSNSFLFRTIFYTTLIFLLVSFGCAKKPVPVCSLELTEVRGFRFGAGLPEIQKRFSNLGIKELASGDDLGILTVTWYMDVGKENATYYPDQLTGLNKVYLTFSGGGLVEIKFNYDETSDKSSEFRTEFYNKIQQSLQLNGEWQQTDQEKEVKTMNCGKYRIEAGLSPKVNTFLSPGDDSRFKIEPFLRIEDVETKNKLRQTENLKRQDEYQKKREEFKP